MSNQINSEVDCIINLVETRNGAFSLQVKSESGPLKALHSLYDPAGEARTIVDAFQFDSRGIIVVLGMGLGYHVMEISKRFPDTAIVVIEAIPEIYEIAKKYIKDFDEDRVKFIVGFNVEKALSEITRYQLIKGMVPLSVFPLSSAVSAFPRYYQPILNKLKNTVSLRLWDRLRYQKFKQERLNIGIIDFEYFLNREVEKAIKGLDHRLARIKGKKDERPGEITGRLIEMIVDFKPDFIIAINHLGFDEEGLLTSFLKSVEMPVASWYVDSPNLILRAFEKNVSPYVSLFLWDKSYIKDMKKMGFEYVEYLPLATDENVFKLFKLSLEDIKRYGCDISFVGNSMVKPARENLEKVKKGLHPLVEKMAQILCQSRISFDEILGDIENGDLIKINNFTPRERLDFETATLWRATLLYRLSCIEALKDFNPVIHGDSGWRKLVSRCFSIKSQLSYYQEIPLFYNACKINFNATSLQMKDAVNQRVFDVPACNGFILTDHQEAIEELFEVGEEVITYKDRDEIPELVRFYLDNPEERKMIAKRARERVLKEHTYKQRLSRIIQIMKERYG